MATTRNPRHGSMQYWPRKRASRPYPRIRHYGSFKAKISGFAGYKVGMTHIIVTDNRSNSMTKGEEISWPVTVVECPPIKVASIRLYKRTHAGLQLTTEIMAKLDKEVARKISITKKEPNLEVSLEGIADVRVNVHTQPKLTGVGKKKPELFELHLLGSLEEKLSFAKEHLGKEIKAEDVLREGQQLDTFVVTKGKGIQGPVKRFGVTLKNHKSEKGVRRVGNIGAWTGNRSWTVARAGRMGFHNRMERNKVVLKISQSPDEINPKGGFLHYGLVRGTYVLIKGSLGGPAKRLVRFVESKRPNHRYPESAPSIEFTSQESMQGL